MSNQDPTQPSQPSLAIPLGDEISSKDKSLPRDKVSPREKVSPSGKPKKNLVDRKVFLIAGGGTGGHIYPGIAIGRALQAMDPHHQVEFVGTSAGLEGQIVPREGFPLHFVSSGKLNYKGSLFKKLWNLLKVFVGLLQSLHLLYRTKPTGVLGVGGYASAPLVAAAFLMRVPTSIWEPNAHPGLTNRWLSRLVDRAFIVFESAKRHLKSPQVIVSGLPVREELESVKRPEPHKEFRVLCFGGSQGAHFINDVVQKSVKSESKWLHQSQLIHQTGVKDYPVIKDQYEKSVFDVKCFEYLFEMNQYYEWADLVICRSGASTLAELCAAGKPSILIPLPSSADDHQKKNAQAMLEAGAALLIEQKDLGIESLNTLLLVLQKDPARLELMAKNARALHKPFAARVMAQELLGNPSKSDSHPSDSMPLTD